MSLLTSLISYWKQDESSGDALDAHGTNPLTQVGSIGTAAGKIGTARDFPDSPSNYFSHADNSDLSTGDIDFTFSCWVYLDSTSGERVPISKANNTSTEYILDIVGGQARFYTGSNFIAGDTLSTGIWYFIIFWRDSTAGTINIQVNNGAVYSLAVAAPVIVAVDFRLGVYGTTPSFGPVDGRIDEVGFWKRVLTADERASLYNSGNGLAYPFTTFVPDYGFAGLWDFAGYPVGVVPTPASAAGHGFHGLSWVFFQQLVEDQRRRSILDGMVKREFRNMVETAIFNKVMKEIDFQVKKKKEQSIAAYTVLLMEV